MDPRPVPGIAYMVPVLWVSTDPIFKIKHAETNTAILPKLSNPCPFNIHQKPNFETVRETLGKPNLENLPQALNSRRT